MTDAVSVRPDDEVQRALRTLEASDLSRSEAIRKSILVAARHSGPRWPRWKPTKPTAER